jgi:toluene monooxygenase system protein E
MVGGENGVTQRTYWHLQQLGRVPSDYDLATSRLLYYPEHGFAVDTKVGAWYARYQAGSPFRLANWETFRDPRETTYSSYTALQDRAQVFVDGIYRSAGAGYDRTLDPAWLGALERVLPVLLYPCHALQMLSAYVGQMAPAGRVVIVSLFQAADEMRRVQAFAYRTRLLQRTFPSFGHTGKDLWQRGPEWQPLRRTLETMLVTYDFGEAFVALGLALKPRFDRLVTRVLGAAAEQHDDPVLEKLVFSLGEDAAWHRAWSHELVREAVRQDPGQRHVIEGWLARWAPGVSESLAGLDALLPAPPEERERLDEIELECREEAERAGLYAGDAS